MPEKADDAAGLSPSKEDNAFWRNSDRKEGEIFIKRLYQTSPKCSAKFFLCGMCDWFDNQAPGGVPEISHVSEVSDTLSRIRYFTFSSRRPKYRMP